MLKSDYLRVSITMPPDMVERLDQLSLKAKVTGGKKLANTELTRAAVNALLNRSKSDIDVSGCKDEEEVENALLVAVRK